MNSLRNILNESSLDKFVGDFDNLLLIVNNSLELAQEKLKSFASETDFDSKMAVAFGNNRDITDLKRAWKVGNFSLFPQIEIRSSVEINGAYGAFSKDTNKIYLAREYLQQNARNTRTIVDVLLEEFGHFVDAQINSSDSPGDEGAIFSALVQGRKLDRKELKRLRAEDDRAVINLDGQEIQIEQRIIFGTDGNDTIWGNLNEDNFISGGGGNDSLVGGDSNDRINGGTGNDTLHGAFGNDTLDGGDGDDTLYGSYNHDLLYGGAGNDIIYDGYGNDIMYGGNGNDTLVGDGYYPFLSGLHGNNDTLFGENGNDSLSGGLGNDSILGGSGNDNIVGENGNDLLSGDAGNDTISGGSGNDYLYAGSGNNYLYGGSGNDVFSGDFGNDTLYENNFYGEDGNDVFYVLSTGLVSSRNILNGGQGSDRYFISKDENYDVFNTTISDAGGEGDEIVFYSLRNGSSQLIPLVWGLVQGQLGIIQDVQFSTDIIIDLNQNGLAERAKDLVIQNFYAAIPNPDGSYVPGTGYIENIPQQPPSINPINGTEGNDTLNGTENNDIINGLGGDDVIDGKAGNDQINGGNGHKEQIFGRDGNDTIIDPDGVLMAHGGAGNDTINITFAANWDNDTNLNNSPRSDGGITGGYGDDNMTITMNKAGFFINLKGDEAVSNNEQDGNDVITLLGTYINAVVDLNGGNDTFNGGVGYDNVSGGSGHDIIIGAAGNDRLVGSFGNDLLTGGSGSDKFVFNTKTVFAAAEIGVDTIADFSAFDTDNIVLHKTTFQALTSISRKTSGFSTINEFAVVNDDSLASTSEALIVYNSSNGNLFYNQNGIALGLGDGGLFANLTGTPLLSANDFIIQA